MRIRTVKPEFFTHEAIFEAEIESGLPLRLSFIGLWCCADRDGKFKWEPRRLGVNILPYDNFDFSEILDALEKFGFVVRFGGGKFGLIPSFKNHQCINQREAQSQIPDPADDCMQTHVHACEPQYNYRGVNIQPKLRAFVFLRDDNKCVRCGSDEDLTVDHIFPQSIGGTHAKQNLRTLCRSCNSARPVAGNALIEDLAKDGLSLDDMERMCMHVCARGEGKGREGNKEGKGKELLSVAGHEQPEELPSYPPIVEALWKLAIPKSKDRSSKKKVYDAWQKLKPKPDEETVKQSFESWSNCHEWTKDGGQYAPGVHLWIKDRKWENDNPPSQPQKPKFPGIAETIEIPIL